MNRKREGIALLEMSILSGKSVAETRKALLNPNLKKEKKEKKEKHKKERKERFSRELEAINSEETRDFFAKLYRNCKD